MTDAQYRWVIVGYTLVIQAVAIGILIYSFALFALPWLDVFNAPRAEVMLTISISQVVAGLVSPAIGRAMDLYPIKRFVLSGLVLLVLGLLAASRAQALWQIQLVYATLFPVSLTLMSTLPAQTLITRWFFDKRGVAIGLSATGTNLGGIVFPLLVAAGLTAFGWRETMVWLALSAVLLVGPLTWWVLRREPAARPAVAGGYASPRSWSSGEILRSGMFWIPSVGLVVLNLGFGAVQFNLGAFGRDVGFSASDAANLIALNAICMICGKFFFGAIGDKADHRVMYWLAATSMALAMIVLQGQPSTTAFIAGVVLVGLSGGGILPMFGVVFGSRFGVASFARVMGFAMLVMTVGAFGPLLAGWAHDLTGSYDFAFQTFLALILTAAILMFWLPKPASIVETIERASAAG